ncbi:conserved hypothetical protein [Cenarchaeum symbiosum A]|uniref:DUF262 domain-containing protein n=1 Tax=Cenarchaeum symbiosum (strain A) TaxID=414004 RepID=A0RWN2_CENSY|nr:conserved hypothetical protein [Cenarchaeum symbiosum A]
MKSEITSITKILDGGCQISVPIYQRGYSWTRGECRQLLEDVKKVSRGERTNHFMGTIVCAYDKDVSKGGMRRYTVVDGQQRLATISLLINAWSIKYKKSLVCDSNQLNNTRNTYLENSYVNNEDKYKLVLTNTNLDRTTYERLMSEKDSTGNPKQKPFKGHSKAIMSAHKFFMSSLDGEKVDLDKILLGIRGLVVAFTEVEYGEDNVQEIFESLNTTGKELSNSDLIRNYMLMNLNIDEQTKLHDPYWRKIESVFSDNPIKFDDFIYNFLLFKTYQKGKIYGKKKTYDKFKEHVRDQMEHGMGKKDILADMDKHAEYYKNIRDASFDDTLDGRKLNRAASLNNLDLGSAYPLLFKLMRDYDSNKLGVDELVEIMGIIESYLFRRKVCGLYITQRRNFLQMMSGVDKSGDYLNNLKRMLARNQRENFPGDGDFEKDFAEMDDAYKLAKYILLKLENHGDDFKTAKKDLTIEHIMPQTIDESDKPGGWRDMLGPDWRNIHAEYLNAVGNLTLVTGPDNPKMSNDPFHEKMEFYTKGNLRLNETVKNSPTWNADTIRSRSRMLAKWALEAWKYPLETEGRLERDTQEDAYLAGVDADSVEVYYSFKNVVQNTFKDLTVKSTSNYIGVYRDGKRLCGIFKRGGMLHLIYRARGDDFEADNMFVRPVSEDGTRTHMSDLGNYMSNMESEEDVAEIMEVLRRLYNDDGSTGVGEDKNRK